MITKKTLSYIAKMFTLFTSVTGNGSFKITFVVKVQTENLLEKGKFVFNK